MSGLAKDILVLIASVDPADTDRMDEIDARTHCFVYGKDYKGFKPKYSGWSAAEYIVNDNVSLPVRAYTRSRDALESIRPPSYQQMEMWAGCAWHVSGQIKSMAHIFFRKKSGALVDFTSLALPTEHLAELHALIQGIDDERQRARLVTS